jgi:6-phospho-beta-glucosidase
MVYLFALDIYAQWGLCNVPVLMQKGIAQVLNAEEKDVFVQVAGLNHFIFARQVNYQGKDQMDFVLEEFLDDNQAFNPKNIPSLKWPRKLLANRHQIPCPLSLLPHSRTLTTFHWGMS